MANPKMRETAYKDMNFEKTYYYEYKPKNREEGAP